MLIKDKINLDVQGLLDHGAITIVALGDSVTHGATAIGAFNHETVYHNRLKKRILEKRPFMPINVINAGVGGTTAKMALPRLERDVFSHNPDLVIVCFGLNDCGYPLEEYTSSLDTIFKRCNDFGVQTIFLTPNMLNTYPLTQGDEWLIKFSEETAERQNSGHVDRYFNEAKKVAEKNGVKIADAYAKWKELHARGIDVTKLLSNGINHPTEEMHSIFTDEIMKLIFDEDENISLKVEDAMDHN